MSESRLRAEWAHKFPCRIDKWLFLRCAQCHDDVLVARSNFLTLLLRCARRVCRTPPMYDQSLGKNVLRPAASCVRALVRCFTSRTRWCGTGVKTFQLWPYAVIIHLGFGLWMLSNTSIIPTSEIAIQVHMRLCMCARILFLVGNVNAPAAATV